MQKKNNNNFIENNDFSRPQNPLIINGNNYNSNNNQKCYDNQPQKRVDEITKGNEPIYQDITNQDLDAPTPYYSS